MEEIEKVNEDYRGATEHSIKLQARIEQIETRINELCEVVNEILKIIEKIK